MSMKKVLKKTVGLLERMLPRSWFNALYSSTFPLYKEAVRQCYRSKWLLFFFKGDAEGMAMVKAIYRIMPYSLVGSSGLEATYRLCLHMNDHKLSGDFVELGVARGGCAALMTQVARSGMQKRNMWLFDSFEGLPEPTTEDFAGKEVKHTGNHVRPLPQGSCKGTLEEVKNLFFNVMRFSSDQLYFIQGWFHDTVPVQKQKISQIAVLRIDGDWYESTKCCLENLYDRVIAGGAVIIDDYQTCFGCKRAVDAFIAQNNLNIEMSFDGRGGCYFIKP